MTFQTSVPSTPPLNNACIFKDVLPPLHHSSNWCQLETWGLLTNENPQHPHALLPLYTMYMSVLLRIKAHNECCWGRAARVRCSAGNGEPTEQQGREGQWPHWQGTQSYCIWARRAEQVQWQEPGSSTVQWSPGKSVVLREVQDWVRKPSQQDKSRTNKTQGWAWHPYNTGQARSRGKSLNLC